jgi:tetratricopeptide (TPR) repeat protein
VADELQIAWGHFHAGEFGEAIKLGIKLGALGAAVANKAAAIETLYSRNSQVEHTLEAAIQRGESAVRQLDDHANTHYTLALVLGRYSQRISILKAVAQGFAGRVRSHLDRTLDLEPQHAEANVALGLYHAELVNKLGSIASSLTYGASASAALEHFGRALKLAPASPIVHIEYANGLLLLDRERYAGQASELYEKAASFEPLDEMEGLDVQRARRGASA